ncbi:MAG: glycoside hydrolase family 9 protein [Hellea sp.]
MNAFSPFNILITITCLTLISACSGGGGSPASPSQNNVTTNTTNTTNTNTTNTNTTVAPTISELIKLNQVGYLTHMEKIAVVPASTTQDFSIVDVASNAEVYSGILSNEQSWAMSGDSIRIADFSALQTSGIYKIVIDGYTDSYPFSIGPDVFTQTHNLALKAYYYNRASTELLAEHAGKWQRPLGHSDNIVLIHESAASSSRPTGTVISSPKGWYDAGDFNKYVVNSGISTYTLLASYLHHSDYYQNINLNIPESDNATADILDEIMWNLDWLLTMQDPNDGGVYHKLTTKNFAAALMPHQATETRYMVQKGTSATLNFASVMATAYRVYKDVPEYAHLSETFLNAAKVAYSWAKQNPNVVYTQPSDIQTGEYGDNNFADEFAWASAELLLSTQDSRYLTEFNQYAATPSAPNWNNTMALGYISLFAEGRDVLNSSEYSDIVDTVINLSNNIVSQHNQSAYKVAMVPGDFVWGSNSSAMNKAMVVLQAYKHSSDVKYYNTALGLLDYVLGKNPLDLALVTGVGTNSPQDPHHRQSYADNIVAPIPGFLVGGPHTGKQDNCNYSGSLPATTYLDDWCSYSTNEVTINWNAPLVYVLAAISYNQ